MPQHEGRIFYLDGIRAFSILLIIVAHFNDALKDLGVSGHVFSANTANLGVSLFIILSGGSLMASHGRVLRIPSFYWKRFLTIFPLFWVCYLLFYIELSIETRTFPPLKGEPVRYLLTLVGMDGFLLYKMENFYLIGEWFLGLIIIFYLIFPLLRMAVLQLNEWALPAAALAVAAAIFIHGVLGVGMGVNRFPPARVLEFVFGMLLVNCWPRAKTVSEKARFIAISLATAGGVYLFLQPAWLMQILLAGLVAFPLLAVLVTPLQNRVSAPVVTFLSAYSYGAFLVHHELISLLLANIPSMARMLLQGVLYPVFFAYILLVFFLSFLVTWCTKAVVNRLTRGRQE